MTVSLVLLALAAAVATTGQRSLVGRQWVPDAPGSAILAWLLLLATGVVAAVGAGLMAIVPLVRHLGGVREFLHRCPAFVVALRAHTLFFVLAGVGTALVGILTGWLFVAIRRHVGALNEDGQRHRLALVADGQGQRPIAIVPADRCAAWSVPAGHGYVVVTTAAARDLAHRELEAVVRHEWAHLRGRHHLILTVLRALRAALPCPVTRAAAAEVAVLLEMRADDRAVAVCGRAVLRTALLRMVSIPQTPAALAITGGSTSRRLRRLAQPGVARWRPAAAVFAGVALSAVVVAVVGSAVTAVLLLHECPLPT